MANNIGTFLSAKNEKHRPQQYENNATQSKKSRGNFKSLQKWQKFLVAICKWSVFGGYPVGSHAQTTIPNSSTIFFQPNFAGLLKLPQTENEKTAGSIYSSQDRDRDSLHELR